jgi:hypothetical protein
MATSDGVNRLSGSVHDSGIANSAAHIDSGRDGMVECHAFKTV